MAKDPSTGSCAKAKGTVVHLDKVAPVDCSQCERISWFKGDLITVKNANGKLSCQHCGATLYFELIKYPA